MNAQALIEENLQTKNPYLNLGRCGLTGKEDFLELLAKCEQLEVLVLDNVGIWHDYDLLTHEWKYQSSKNNWGDNKLVQLPVLPPSLKKLSLGGVESVVISNIEGLESLTQLELLELRGLAGVQTLDFLKYLTSLKYLKLSDFPDLVDIRALELFQGQLVALELVHCNVLEKFDSLATLGKLRSLRLALCPKLLQVDALATLTQLQNLMLHGNETLVDISGIRNLSQLQKASVYALRALQNFTPLRGLIQTKSLFLADNPYMANLDFAQSLTTLKKLEVFNCPNLADIGGLAHKPQLESISIQGQSLISDLSPLAQLSSLKSLGIQQAKVDNLQAIGSLTQLESLNLWGNQIQNLDAVQHLTQLRNLGLGHNHITDISLLSHLPNLESLELQHNQIENIHSLQNLPSLVNLHLGNNKIKDVSDIDKFPQLATLDLCDNQVVNITPLQHLPSLQVLVLRNNHIKELQLLSGGFTELHTLYISNNKLKKLSIKGLPRLKEISATSADTEITELVIEALPCITVLEFNGLKIQKAYFGNLPHLQKLNLENNVLTQLGLQNLTALSELKLDNNQLKSIDVLGKVENLEKVDLTRNNHFDDIDFLAIQKDLQVLMLAITKVGDITFVENLSKLKFLDISITSVRDFKPLGKITQQLEGLHLSNLQISDLSFLKSFTHLKQLVLRANLFSDIAPLAYLNDLEFLDLSKNRKITGYRVLSGLSQLKILRLTDNRLTDISFIASLRQLINLEVDQNKVQNVIPLKGLSNLKYLNLRENKVENLPWSFLQSLSGLERINLWDNPIKNIPTEIFTSGLKALQDYFVASEQSQVKVYQHKLILIGNGRVGKTTLVKRWLDNTFDPHEPSTHAIQLRTHALKTLATEKDYDLVQLNIWDFGGQDIYHSTHRVFIQTQAVFLLLWDMPTEQALYQKDENTSQKTSGYQDTRHSLMDWLSYVETLSKDSPVIVVQTKRGALGQAQDPPNKATIQEKYGTYLKGFLSVESSEKSKYQNGLAELLNRLTGVVETEMKKGCTNLPTSWWQVQQAIHKLPKKQRTLAWDHFQEICLQSGVLFDSIRTLEQYLHNTGFFFYRSGYFDKDIILDQQWIIDIVYALFDRENDSLFLDLQKKGGFKGKDLVRAWKTQGHSEESYELFTSFMESCGVCVEVGVQYADKEQKQRIRFAQREYLAPQLLPDEAISNIEGYFPANQGLFYKFTHPFLHAAVIQQFIVRNVQYAYNNDLEANIKKNSVFLEIKGQKALVEAFPRKNELLVRIPQTEHQVVLDRVHQELKAIQRGHYGIQEWVAIDGEGYVLLEELKQPSQNSYIRASNGKEYLRNDFMVFQGVSTRKFKPSAQQNDSNSHTQTKIMRQKEVVIFTGFANPGKDLGCLSKEQKGIHDALHPLESKQELKKHLWRDDLDTRAYFELLQAWANQISIFHFGGHANSTQLGLHDHSAFFGSLAEELIARNKDSLQLVFLNGCSTKAHVQTLFDLGAKAVIATSATVQDSLAAELAICFYENLAKGDTIVNAFNSGIRYLKSIQQNTIQPRILEQPESYRGSAYFLRKKEENEVLPWGLYFNDDQVLHYKIIQDTDTPQQNSPERIVQYNTFNTVSNQGTIISGPVAGGINITHHHGKSQNDSQQEDNTNS